MAPPGLRSCATPQAQGKRRSNPIEPGRPGWARRPRFASTRRLGPGNAPLLPLLLPRLRRLQPPPPPTRLEARLAAGQGNKWRKLLTPGRGRGRSSPAAAGERQNKGAIIRRRPKTKALRLFLSFGHVGSDAAPSGAPPACQSTPVRSASGGDRPRPESGEHGRHGYPEQFVSEQFF